MHIEKNNNNNNKKCSLEIMGRFIKNNKSCWIEFSRYVSNFTLGLYIILIRRQVVITQQCNKSLSDQLCSP